MFDFFKLENLLDSFIEKNETNFNLLEFNKKQYETLRQKLLNKQIPSYINLLILNTCNSRLNKKISEDSFINEYLLKSFLSKTLDSDEIILFLPIQNNLLDNFLIQFSNFSNFHLINIILQLFNFKNQNLSDLTLPCYIIFE